MDQTQIRVACYARYSTSIQREESISAQMRAMKKFCDDNGWVIVKRYVDEAYSATTDRRPQFQEMIFDSGKKEFEIVLVHKLDRFARNRYDSILYKQKLRKNGVRLCSVLERIDNTPESILLEDVKMTWNSEGIRSAVKKLLKYQAPLFESLANKLEQYPELRQQLILLLINGKRIPYRPDDDAIKQLIMFGFAREQNGNVVIANRIFETRFYDMLLTETTALDSLIYLAGERQKPEFVSQGKLNMELVLEKFVQYFHDIYGDKTERFIENDGRKLFLLYLRPIINGVGNYYIEAQTRDLTRTDVVVDYLGEQFVIEMKIWHGKEYNERGETQLAEYLDYYHISKGYLLSFSFNQNKEIGTHTIQLGDKMIFEAIV